MPIILSGDGGRDSSSTSADGSLAEESVWTDIGGYSPGGSAGIALGDLDADGTPEIVTISSDLRVLALHADGSLLWASDVLSSDLSSYGYPSIADLDGEGLAKVIAGRAILDHTGALIGRGALGWGGLYAISVVADLNVDKSQEVIAGNAIYRADGSSVWERSDIEDGWPAVADLDDDGLGEVVSVHGGTGTVTLLDNDDGTIWGPVSVPGGGGGPPTGATNYSVFDTDSTVLWQHAHPRH